MRVSLQGLLKGDATILARPGIKEGAEKCRAYTLKFVRGIQTPGVEHLGTHQHPAWQDAEQWGTTASESC